MCFNVCIYCCLKKNIHRISNYPEIENTETNLFFKSIYFTFKNISTLESLWFVKNDSER